MSPPRRGVAAMDLDSMREAIARQTHRGIGMPAAGLAYWLAMTQVFRSLPLESAILVAFIATGAVFPLGALVSKWIGADLFSRGHPLTQIGMTLNFVQFADWPIIVVMFWFAPEWTVFTMATLFGSHFLPYGWLYRSAGYTMLGVASTILPTLLAMAGWRRPEITALAMGVAHAIAVVRIHAENRRSFAQAAAAAA